MSTKEIRQKANLLREEAHVRIENYVKDKSYDKSEIKNSGQMKFLADGLLIRHLTVNTHEKVNAGLTRVIKRMDETIFLVDEEVVEFSDKEKLLQKAQEEMERSFVSYLRCNESKENVQVIDKNKIYKETRYFNFLMSTALYEIFIAEYNSEVCEKYDLDKYKKMEAAEEIEKLLAEFQEVLNDKEKTAQLRQEIPKLQEKMQQYQADMDEFFETMSCMHLYMLHLRNLYAMLRVIEDIEFIQINERKDVKGNEKRIANEKAHALYKSYEDDEMTLAFTSKYNRNLGYLFNQFNKVYVTFLDKDTECHQYYQKKFGVQSEPELIKEYTHLIEKKVLKSLTEKEGGQLETITDILAGYMSFAENDILEIQKRAKK